MHHTEERSLQMTLSRKVVKIAMEREKGRVKNFELSNMDVKRLCRHWVISDYLKKDYDEEKLRLIKEHLEPVQTDDLDLRWKDFPEKEEDQKVMDKVEQLITELQLWLVRCDQGAIIVDYSYKLSRNRVKKQIEELEKEGKFGWTCGTGRSKQRILHIFQVAHQFDMGQMEYIIAHLPEENDIDTDFCMKDPQNQDLCDLFNVHLDQLIPRIIVHVNSI